MPLNASAEAKATAEQTISALQGGHYPWQKGWLKRIPGIYARLLNYLVPYAKTVIVAMFFMVITALTSSMIAVLMGKLTDQGFYAKDVNALWWAPAALIAVALLQGGSTFGSSYLLQKVSQQVLLKIRCEMFEREIRWPAANYQKYTSGIVMSKYINEASTALGGAAQLLTTIVRDSLQLVALLGLLIWHDWKLTLVTLVVAPLIAVILRWVNKKTKKYGLQTQTALGNMMNTVLEAYQGQRIIKIYDAYEKEQTRFRGVNELLYKLSMRMQAVTAAGTPLTQFVTMAGVSIVVIVALLQAQAGHLTLGDFITFLSALLLLMNPVKKLSALNGSVARISAAAESLFTTMDEVTEKDPGNTKLPRLLGGVRFEHVGYRYAGAGRQALSDISFEVNPGETIAFVGASGAGKTTLINLIPRFWQPTEGEIYFDGIPQSTVTLKSLRQQIALVSQDVVLFDDTIAANIAYGMENVSEEDIRKAADAAYLTPFIRELPEGLNSPVGPAGQKLSGGQKQRISIARALLKNAPILLLDEATSALDTESEKYIQLSLDRLMKGRTTFVVAHRLSTIMGADKIVVIKEGRICEMGRHEELLAKKGAYAHLYNIQFMQKPTEDKIQSA